MGTERPLQAYLQRIDAGESIDSILPDLPVFVTKAKAVAFSDHTSHVPKQNIETISFVPKSVYSNPWDEISVLLFGKPALEGRYLVGRTQNCALTIANPTVSKEHAEIYKSGELWLVKDLGSTNGTSASPDAAVYKDICVGQPYPLRSMEWIRFGSVETQFFTPSTFSDYVKFMDGLYKQRKKLV